jgi:hypothetical protein
MIARAAIGISAALFLATVCGLVTGAEAPEPHQLKE